MINNRCPRYTSGFRIIKNPCSAQQKNVSRFEIAEKKLCHIIIKAQILFETKQISEYSENWKKYFFCGLPWQYIEPLSHFKLFKCQPGRNVRKDHDKPDLQTNITTNTCSAIGGVFRLRRGRRGGDTGFCLGSNPIRIFLVIKTPKIWIFCQFFPCLAPFAPPPLHINTPLSVTLNFITEVLFLGMYDWIWT